MSRPSPRSKSVSVSAIPVMLMRHPFRNPPMCFVRRYNQIDQGTLNFSSRKSSPLIRFLLAVGWLVGWLVGWRLHCELMLTGSWLRAHRFKTINLKVADRLWRLRSAGGPSNFRCCFVAFLCGACLTAWCCTSLLNDVRTCLWLQLKQTVLQPVLIHRHVSWTAKHVLCASPHHRRAW